MASGGGARQFLLEVLQVSVKKRLLDKRGGVCMRNVSSLHLQTHPLEFMKGRIFVRMEDETVFCFVESN